MRKRLRLTGFGKRLRAARVAAGRTQRVLGEQLGLTPERIGQFERRSRPPQARTIARLEAALGLAPGALDPQPDLRELRALRRELLEIVQAARAAARRVEQMLPAERGPAPNPLPREEARCTRCGFPVGAHPGRFCDGGAPVV